MDTSSHPLVNTTAPNLLEETFGYNLSPLIHFDSPIVEYIDGKQVEFDPNSVRSRDIVVGCGSDVA